MYQQPNNQPPTYYPPQPPPGYPPQQQWQPPQVPPRPRPVRMQVKIASIVCFALGLTVAMAGVPALLPIGGLLLLTSFVLIFLI